MLFYYVARVGDGRCAALPSKGVPAAHWDVEGTSDCVVPTIPETEGAHCEGEAREAVVLVARLIGCCFLVESVDGLVADRHFDYCLLPGIGVCDDDVRAKEVAAVVESAVDGDVQMTRKVGCEEVEHVVVAGFIGREAVLAAAHNMGSALLFQVAVAAEAVGVGLGGWVERLGASDWEDVEPRLEAGPVEGGGERREFAEKRGEILLCLLVQESQR